jgi:hypothetical protein
LDACMPWGVPLILGEVAVMAMAPVGLRPSGSHLRAVYHRHGVARLRFRQWLRQSFDAFEPQTTWAHRLWKRDHFKDPIMDHP